MSPIKIEPRLIIEDQGIGDWRKGKSLLEMLKTTEKDFLKIKPDLSVLRKHSKINPSSDTRDGIVDPKEKKIIVKMLKDIKAAPDHIHVLELKKEEKIELPESMAKRFIEKKLAVKINRMFKKKGA